MQTCLAWLNNLGVSFQNRFKCTGDLADIFKAISSLQKAVQLTPEGHADMLTQLSNLGVSFSTRFNCTGDLTDISEAISFSRKQFSSLLRVMQTCLIG
jgi:hypothetical protein